MRFVIVCVRACVCTLSGVCHIEAIQWNEFCKWMNQFVDRGMRLAYSYYFILPAFKDVWKQQQQIPAKKMMATIRITTQRQNERLIHCTHFYIVQINVARLKQNEKERKNQQQMEIQ